MARAARISNGAPRKVYSSSKKARLPYSKGKGKAPAIDDVYEYAPSKVHHDRAKVTLDLDHHEAGRRRYDSDDEIDLGGMGQEAMKKLRARLAGENEDDEQVDSEDDEEIDSDGAFEDTDRDEFAGSGFTRKGSKRTASRAAKFSKNKREKIQEVNLSEDSDASASASSPKSDPESEGEDAEMEDGSAGDFFDVLDVFDGRADVEDDEGAPPKIAKKSEEVQRRIEVDKGDEEDEEEWKGAGEGEGDDDDDDDDESEGEEDDEDDEDLFISASDSEGPSPEALAELESFITKLDPTDTRKRKSDNAPAPETRTKKRRILAERTEAGEESEFGARGSSTLKLDDLLAPLASSSSALAVLKRSTKPLTSSNSKTKTLAAPLPQRAQERLDREAAYEQTKNEVDKWSATMRRIKEAEHLSFPLQSEKPGRVSNLELAAKFTPSNELESAVDKLLKSAQFRDEDISHTEALKMAHLSVEEVAARRSELRMMRELAFRADRKAKRMAKIKSKAYRRIRKKQRERLDGADADVDVDDEGARLKAEVERARERATLRHKHTGKWAKAMKGHEGLDQDQRQAIGEMLERGEKLRRRIRGEDSGDDMDDEDSESEGADEQDEEVIKRKVFDELAALRAEDDADAPELKSKSVFNMKFMRAAAARQSREVDANAEELAREMGFGHDGEEGDGASDAAGDSPTTDTAMVHRTGGRVSFRPGASAAAAIISRPLESLPSDTSSVTLQSTDLINADVTPTPSLTPTPTVPAPALNPWLVASTSSGPSRKKNEVRVHKDADSSLKSSHKLRKQAARRDDEKERARDDAVLEIDTDKVLTIPKPSVSSSLAKGKAKSKEGGAKAVTANDEDESDAHSELEEQERAIEGKNRTNPGKGVRAFQQRDLVALAFAGDNVVQAFEESKGREIEADAPHEVDTTLPGWGSWGGSGTKKLPPKPHLIKKVAGVDPSSRADYKKAHVIISEKRDKKAAKYLVKDLPYPYTSHAQFERSMDMPIGTEWNTRVGFQRGTLPRVVKKASGMGAVIDPLEKLF
ncbi:Utp14 protein-domain-containing protein [Melanogaster broomeanus]|nr:Utp14 protein-domain-containing protein [Melanogaster broomeanus]